VNTNLHTSTLNDTIAVLNEERVIAYPTEAVFGVGCDPDSETAVMRLLELKQRPMEKGLILIAASFEQLLPYIDDSMLTGLPANLTPSPYASPTTRWWWHCVTPMANRWYQPAPT